jgi:hypothetical protein
VSRGARSSWICFASPPGRNDVDRGADETLRLGVEGGSTCAHAELVRRAALRDHLPIEKDERPRERLFVRAARGHVADDVGVA